MPYLIPEIQLSGVCLQASSFANIIRLTAHTFWFPTTTADVCNNLVQFPDLSYHLQLEFPGVGANDYNIDLLRQILRIRHGGRDTRSRPL